MKLEDFNREILAPMLLRQIESGRLDHAIQSDDCQDIIESNPELKKAVEQRLKVIRDA